MEWFTKGDEVNTSLFQIIFLDGSKSEYSADDLNYNTTNQIFTHLSENKDNIFFISIEHANENDLYVEFGKGCCFISMPDEEKAEAYSYLNPHGDKQKYIDFIANCYPQNMLCYHINDLLRIIKTFISTGKPDNSFQWGTTAM